MADQSVAPADAPETQAPPTWNDVQSTQEFQSSAPDKKLVAFDRWRTAAQGYASTLPDWEQVKDKFAEKTSAIASHLGGAARSAAPDSHAFAAPMTADEARYRLAKSTLAQNPNTKLPEDFQAAYDKGPPDEMLRTGTENAIHNTMNTVRSFGTAVGQGLENAVGGIARNLAHGYETGDIGVPSYLGGEKIAGFVKAAQDELGLGGARDEIAQHFNNAADYMKQRAANVGKESGLDPALENSNAAKVARFTGQVAAPLLITAIFKNPSLGMASFVAEHRMSTYGEVYNETGDHAAAMNAANRATIGDALFIGVGGTLAEGLGSVLEKKGVEGVQLWAAKASAATGGNIGVNQLIKAADAAANAKPGERIHAFSTALRDVTLPDLAVNAAFGIMAGSHVSEARRVTDQVSEQHGALKRAESSARDAGMNELADSHAAAADKVVNDAVRENEAKPEIQRIDDTELNNRQLTIEQQLNKARETNSPDVKVLTQIQTALATEKLRRQAEVTGQPAPAPAPPPAAPPTPEQIEKGRVDKDAAALKDRIVNEARQQTISEGVPTAARAGRIEEIISQERQVGLSDKDPLIREGYRLAHQEASAAVDQGPNAGLERPTHFNQTATEQPPDLYTRKPPKAAAEIGAAPREAAEGIEVKNPTDAIPAGSRVVDAALVDNANKIISRGASHAEAMTNAPSEKLPDALEAMQNDQRHQFAVQKPDGTVVPVDRVTAQQLLGTEKPLQSYDLAKMHADIGAATREKDLWGKAGQYLTDEQKTSVSDRFINRVTDIFNKFKPHKTIKDAAEGKFLKGWYDEFGKWMLDLMGPETPRFARLFGAFGANNEPMENTLRALNVWNTWVERGRPMDAASVDKILEDTIITETGRAKGRTAKDIMAWGRNVSRVLTAEDPTKVKLSGPKVDPYAANFLGDLDRATLDRHMGIPYALQQGLPLVESMQKGSTIFGVRRPKTPEGDVLGTQGFPGMAYEAHLRHAAEAISEQTGESWRAANVQEAIWGKYQPMKMLSEEMGVKLDDLLSGKVKYSKERLAELREKIQPKTILEDPRVKAEIARLELANQPSGDQRVAATATPPGEQPGASTGAAGLGAGIGAEAGAVTHESTWHPEPLPPDEQGRREVGIVGRKPAVDIGATRRLKPTEEAILDKEVQERLKEVLPETTGRPKEAQASEEGKGSPVWLRIYNNAPSELYYNPRYFEGQVKELVQAGHSREDAIRALLGHEMIHWGDNTPLSVAEEHGRELATKQPELARQIADRYISQKIPDQKLQIEHMVDPNGKFMANLSSEAVEQVARMRLKGEVMEDMFRKLPDGIIERARAAINRQIRMWQGNRAYAKLSADMKARVDRATEILKLMDKTAEERLVTQKAPIGEPTTGQDIGAAPRGPPATVNVGLNVGDKEANTPEQTIAALEQHPDVNVTKHTVHQSGTERTVVGDLSRPLTPDEAHKTAADLNQEAIAQHTGGVGELHGPGAEKWRPFNPDYFLTHEGKPLSAQVSAAPREEQKPFAKALDVAVRPGEVGNMLNAFASDLEKNDRGAEWQRVAPALRHAAVQIGESFGQKENIQMVRDAVKATDNPQDLADTLRSIADSREATGRQGQAMGFGSGDQWLKTAKALRTAADAIDKPNVVHADFGAAPHEGEKPFDINEYAKLAGVAQPTEAPGGIAARVAEARGVPVEPGTSEGTESYVAKGRKRLEAGANAEARMDELQTNKLAAGPDDIGLFRARLEQLQRESNSRGEISPEEIAFEKKYAPIRETWAQAGHTMQGETELDTGHILGLQRMIAQSRGRAMKPSEQPIMEQIVGETQKQNQIENEATQKFRQALIDQAPTTTRVALDKDSLSKLIAQYLPKSEGEISMAARNATSAVANIPKNVKLAVWKYAKDNYLTGEKYITLDDTETLVGRDLGLTPLQVREIISEPKALRTLSNEAYAAAAQRRFIVSGARTLINALDEDPVKQNLKKAWDSIRSLVTLGHANAPITHAGMLLFDPKAWGQMIPSIKMGFKLLLSPQGPAAFEQMMQEVTGWQFNGKPAYGEWTRAGLQAKTGVEDEVATYLTNGLLGRIGIRGRMAMSVLKWLRMARMDFNMSRMTPEERADPESVARMAGLVNNETGILTANTRLGRAASALAPVTFAGQLEGARWKNIVLNPIEAARLYAKGDKATTDDKVFRSYVLKQTAKRIGMLTAALGFNALMNNNFGKGTDEEKINFLDPTKADWMAFKWGGQTVSTPSNFLAPLRLTFATLSAPFIKGAKNNVMDRLSQYASGKLHPGFTDAMELVQGKQAFTGRPLPWASEQNQWAGHGSSQKAALAWWEYVVSKGPIPIAQAVQDTTQALQEEGIDGDMAKIITAASIGLSGGVLGLHAHETFRSKPHGVPWDIFTEGGEGKF